MADDGDWMGFYGEEGTHFCPCGEPSRYQMFSGGTEWWCESCGAEGTYPEGEGGPRARLLAQGPDGVALLRAQMDQELARRKEERARKLD